MDGLQEARKIINEVDAQMARLFVRRMRAVETIAEYKRSHGMPILDAAREEEILRAGAERVEDDDLRDYYAAFMRDMMSVSRRYQQELIHGREAPCSAAEGDLLPEGAHKDPVYTFPNRKV